MACIKWTDSYNFGIREIDSQHIKLADIMNRLCEAMDNGKEGYVINQILDELADYALEHFDTEEKYFLEFKYEGAEEHKSQHEIFRKKIQAIYKCKAK